MLHRIDDAAIVRPDVDVIAVAPSRIPLCQRVVAAGNSYRE